MMTQRESFLAGVRAVAPFLIGVVPFGLIYGLIAVASGIAQLPAIFMSSIVFAGASQIAVSKLVGDGAPILIVIATGLIINARFVMYSAAMTTHFREVSLLRRWPLAYVLSDQAYAVSAIRFEKDETVRRVPFFLGAALTLYGTWQAASTTGVLVGVQVPASWGLEFSVPLMFLALLVPTLRDRTPLIVALVSGGSALALHRLPMHSGFIVSAAVALGVGALLEARRR